MLTAEEQSELTELLAHMPGPLAARIDALLIMQRHRRYISDETLAELAAFLDLAPEELESVATFYNLIWRRPVGRHVILLCNSISCWIMGGDAIRTYLERKLGIALGETTGDDRFTLLAIPCLGACDRAPAMMIDDDLHGALTTERIDAILGRYP